MMRHDDNIELVYGLIGEGNAQALAALLPRLGSGLRHLERGDYVYYCRGSGSLATDDQPALERAPRPSVWLPALRGGNLGVIRALLDGGVSPVRPDARGVTPLLEASAVGNIEVVRILFEYGADPNGDPVPGVTPLHVASSVEMIDVLVDAGGNVNAPSDDGKTPLLFLAYEGTMDGMVHLVRRGANPHVRTPYGQSLLGVLLEVFDDELDPAVLKDLHDAGYDMADQQRRYGDEYPNTSDELDACLEALGVVVDRPVREFDEFHDDELAYLEAALEEKRFDDVDELIQAFMKRGDVAGSDWGKRALTAMAAVDYCPGVTELLTVGVNPARDDTDSVHTTYFVVREKSEAALRLLTSYGASLNVPTDGRTLLQEAASDRDEDYSVQLLLELGANPNARGKFGLTPLHDAASPRMVELLLAAGADVDAQDEKGRTPLFMVRMRYNNGVFERLLESGADPNARAFIAEGGTTVAHRILGPLNPFERIGPFKTRATLEALVRHGFDARFHQERFGDLFLGPVEADAEGAAAIARALIANGADPNQRDGAGRSSLHLMAAPLAVSENLEAAIEVLVSSGADPEARDDAGDTPLLAAAKVGHECKLHRLNAFCSAVRHFARAKALKLGAEVGPVPEVDELAAEAIFRAGFIAPYDAIKRLVALGADVNATDRAGRKALLYAAVWGSAASVAALLDAGADVHEEDPLGMTPLLAAVSPPCLERGISGRIDAGIFDVLIGAGADPHAICTVGISAYEYVTMPHHTDGGYRRLGAAWNPS